jgi:hypothetical protein
VNAFVGYDDATLCHDQFDVAQAEAEDVIQSDSVADDLCWKPAPGIRRGLTFHAGSFANLPPKRQTRG